MILIDSHRVSVFLIKESEKKSHCRRNDGFDRMVGLHCECIVEQLHGRIKADTLGLDVLLFLTDSPFFQRIEDNMEFMRRDRGLPYSAL